MNEQETGYIDELYRKKGEIQKQLLKIEEQIREHIENEFRGKLNTAMGLLNQIYNEIPNAKHTYIETNCDRCEDVITIGLDDALDKIQYVFDRLIKQ